MNRDRVATLTKPNTQDLVVLQTSHPQPGAPVTKAVRTILSTAGHSGMTDDLLYLERWEIAPLPGAAAALRISQIRRANPVLAAAVRAELAALR